MEERDCPVCAKHRGAGPLVGPVVHADDLVVVTHRGDGLLGHGFVEPRRHVVGLDGLTDAEAERIGRCTARLARGLTIELGAVRVQSFVAGLAVAHLHQHVLAVLPGTPPEQPWWQPWCGGPRGDAEARARALAVHFS